MILWKSIFMIAALFLPKKQDPKITKQQIQALDNEKFPEQVVITSSGTTNLTILDLIKCVPNFDEQHGDISSFLLQSTDQKYANLPTKNLQERNCKIVLEFTQKKRATLTLQQFAALFTKMVIFIINQNRLNTKNPNEPQSEVERLMPVSVSDERIDVTKIQIMLKAVLTLLFYSVYTQWTLDNDKKTRKICRVILDKLCSEIQISSDEFIFRLNEMLADKGQQYGMIKLNDFSITIFLQVLKEINKDVIFTDTVYRNLMEIVQKQEKLLQKQYFNGAAKIVIIGVVGTGGLSGFGLTYISKKRKSQKKQVDTEETGTNSNEPTDEQPQLKSQGN